MASNKSIVRRVVMSALLSLGMMSVAPAGEHTAGTSEMPLPKATRQFQPTEESLAKHRVPSWYQDAKLGIFIHWGIYSVPGYAPREAREFRIEEIGAEQKRVNPYAEWYYNTLRIPNSPTAQFHRNAYGANFNYYDFAHVFNADTKLWDPAVWARLFKETGARYVVLTTKHHDGFTLWPSDVKNPHLRPDQSHSTRDLVGDLANAVRQNGMKMGVYYSGLYDWSFGSGPFIADDNDTQAVKEQGPEYPAYADAQIRELLVKYRPDILWNDIGYPPEGKALELASEFYNSTPDGVINDRWKPFKFHDFTTPEYAKPDSISTEKWEECRGLGKSFGLNRIEGPDETISAAALVSLLVDVVAKNGNLLLDVGPEPDGTIPPIQVDRLHQLGAWLKQNGEAIFGTRPWRRATGKTAEGIDVRFTAKDNAVYAVLLGKPKENSVVLLDVGAFGQGRATLLGSNANLNIVAQGNNLLVKLPAELPGNYAWVIRLD
jgi:alpha-L-fucosidase